MNAFTWPSPELLAHRESVAIDRALAWAKAHAGPGSRLVAGRLEFWRWLVASGRDGEWPRTSGPTC